MARRRRQRRGTGAFTAAALPRAAAAWLLALVLAPASEVAAAPDPVHDDPARWLAVLEAQGEMHAALDFLAASRDSLEAALGPDEVAARQLRFLLRVRRHDDALELLETEPSWLPAPERVVLEAVVYLRERRWDAAAAVLDSLHGCPPALAGYAAFLQAEAQHALQRWEPALDAVRRARRHRLPIQMRQRMRVIEGQAALETGDWKLLEALAPHLGRDARDDDRTALLLHALARASYERGRVEAAVRWWFDLLESRPAPAESAYVALRQRLDDPSSSWTPTPGQRLDLAVYEIQHGHTRRGRQRLRALLDRADLTREARGEAHVRIAESYQLEGRETRCLASLDGAAAEIRDTAAEAEMLRLQARSHRRLGHEDQAIRIYRDLARRFPAHPRADDALYEAGWRHEIGERFAAAESTYAEVVRAFPRSRLADDALLRQGLCALRAGNLQRAARYFDRLVRRFPESDLVPRALYWQAWIHERRGDTTAAAARRERLLRQYPRSYYAVLADSSAAWRPAAPLDPVADVSRCHARYLAAIEVVRGALRAPVPDAFEAEAGLWRFLIDRGLEVHGVWEAERLERRYRSHPAALLELLEGMYRRGLPERLVRLAWKLRGLRREPQLDQAIEILRYPAPFTLSVDRAARRHGLSPALLLGLMRQESAFDPRVDSHAGARGLMQIMPRVGRRLAREVPGAPASWHPDALYVPETNLRLGSYLLAKEFEQAAGVWPQALAAYNAGRRPAARWAKRLRPHEPPEMYLDVAEYYETRQYIEKVLGNRATYQRLYDLP